MTAYKIIGRETEQRRLMEASRSKEPELVALYGRRRVGKTFLVRELFRDSIAFELTGDKPKLNLSKGMRLLRRRRGAIAKRPSSARHS